MLKRPPTTASRRALSNQASSSSFPRLAKSMFRSAAIGPPTAAATGRSRATTAFAFPCPNLLAVAMYASPSSPAAFFYRGHGCPSNKNYLPRINAYYMQAHCGSLSPSSHLHSSSTAMGVLSTRTAHHESMYNTSSLWFFTARFNDKTQKIQIFVWHPSLQRRRWP
jgi:hypothetical protein